VDNPLANGDLAHGVTTPVPNLTRLVVAGLDHGAAVRVGEAAPRHRRQPALQLDAGDS